MITLHKLPSDNVHLKYLMIFNLLGFYEVMVSQIVGKKTISICLI